MSEKRGELSCKSADPKGKNTTASQSSRSSRGREVRGKQTKKKPKPQKRQKQEAAADPIHNPTEHQNGGELGRKQKNHNRQSQAQSTKRGPDGPNRDLYDKVTNPSKRKQGKHSTRPKEGKKTLAITNHRKENPTPERAITSSQTPKRPECQLSRASTRGKYRTLNKSFVLLPRGKLQQCCLIQLGNTNATSEAPPQATRDKRKNTNEKNKKIFRRSAVEHKAGESPHVSPPKLL